MSRIRLMALPMALCVVACAGSLSWAAAPQPPATGFGGPQIAGICILDQQAIFSTSKVGSSATARYKQMRDAAQSGVNADQAKITADAKALSAKKLQGQALQQAQQQLAKRLQDLRDRASKESQELEATRQSAATRIAAAAQPLIKQVYDQKKCGLLLARTAILAGNSGMDITPAVIHALDAKVTSIAFDKSPAPVRR